MGTANRRSPYAAFLKGSCLLAPASLMGCTTPSPSSTPPAPMSSCSLGKEVVIPASDATDPTVVLDFFLPNGQTVSVSPNSVPSTVIVPRGGTVALWAKASDGQGIKDVQLWIGTKTCSIDASAGTAACSGPGLLGAPTASNRDTDVVGQNGCTERMVAQNLVVKNTRSSSVSYEVEVRGVNFGGREVRIPMIRLEAQ
jgi:hypothetical protein